MDKTWAPPSGWEERPVCVIGGGVLGQRIAACFVAAGCYVTVCDPSEKSRTAALAYVRTNLSSYTVLTNVEAGTCNASDNLQDSVKGCWLVVEAIPEILKLKQELFANLERWAPSDAILATNSSSYKSREIVSEVSTGTRARTLNTHFMMPPQALIVELMTSGMTYPDIFPFLADRLKAAGLHPVMALKESSGFVFNRLWAAIKREVLSILEEGVATPETIDSMWIEQYVNQKIGPCRMMDSVGLDTVLHIEQHYVDERKLPNKHLEYLQSNFIDHGKLGTKSDRGGLYPVPPPGSLTKIFVLNIGLGEPLKGKSMSEIMHSGQILSVFADVPVRPTELVGKLYNPDGIDIASSTQRMYWTTMGNPAANDGAIQSANLDGSDVQYILEPGKLHTGKQLSIDQKANKIYFCDREGLKVMRCDLDGRQLETLYQTGDWQAEPDKAKDQTLWPVGIAISRKLNKFFWTQKGGSKASQGRIFHASLDMPAGETAATRSDVEVLIENLPECIDLEIDDDKLVLYWTDRGELPLGNTLNKKHLTETPPEEKALGRQILAQGLGEGIGLRLDKSQNCLYVADMSGHVWKCSTEPGMKEKVMEGLTHAYTGLALLKV